MGCNTPGHERPHNVPGQQWTSLRQNVAGALRPHHPARLSPHPPWQRWRTKTPLPRALGSMVALAGRPRFNGKIGTLESAPSRRGWCLVRMTDGSLYRLKLRHLVGTRAGQPSARSLSVRENLLPGARLEPDVHLVLAARLERAVTSSLRPAEESGDGPPVAA